MSVNLFDRNRLTTGLVLALLLSCVAGAEGATADFAIHPGGGTRFDLRVHKTGFMSGKAHLFEFARYSGSLQYDAAKPESSRIRLLIESSSAICKDDWVKPNQVEDIRQHAVNEMLAAKDYPEIVFESRRIVSVSDAEYRVEGTLTIRDQPRPVNVSVTIEKASDGRLWFSGRAEVKLKDYGLKPPKAVLGMIGTKNEMDLEFRLLAMPAATSGQ